MEAIYSMLSLALGESLGGWVLSAGRQALFFIPAILTLPRAAGLNGVIFAQPAADVITGSGLPRISRGGRKIPPPAGPRTAKSPPVDSRRAVL